MHLLVLLAGLAFGGDEEPPVDEPEEVRDLTPRRQSEENALFADHPVDGPLYFKPGSGLRIASADDKFALYIGMRIQFLYTFDTEGPAQQIAIRRARLNLRGHYWTETNTYQIQLGFSPFDQSVEDGPTETALLDWNTSFERYDAIHLRVGQHKIHYNRELITSSGSMLFVERSPQSDTFNLSRDIGLEISSADIADLDRLRYSAGVYAGEGRNAFEPTNLGLLYVARFEYLPYGMFLDYVQGDLDRGDLRISLGGAYAFVHQPQGSKDILVGAKPRDVYSYSNLTADAIVRIAGFDIEGALYWRDGAKNDRRPFAEVGTGYVAQVGYVAPVPIGVAWRYGHTRPYPDTALDFESNTGPAVIYFIHRHAFKLQADYLRAWGADGFGQGSDLIRVLFQGIL